MIIIILWSQLSVLWFDTGRCTVFSFSTFLGGYFLCNGFVYFPFSLPRNNTDGNSTLKIVIIAHSRGSMLMLLWMLRWFLRVHDRSRLYTVQMCTPESTYTGPLSTNQRLAKWVTDQWEASIARALETPASALHQHNSPSVVSWPRGGEVSHRNPQTIYIKAEPSNLLTDRFAMICKLLKMMRDCIFKRYLEWKFMIA